MVLSTNGVKPDRDFVSHRNGNLNVHIRLATGVLSLGICSIVDELDGEVGSFSVGCIFVQVLLELAVLGCLLWRS